MKIFQYISASIFFSALLMGCSNEPRDEEIVRLITNDLKADAASLIDKKVFCLLHILFQIIHYQ